MARTILGNGTLATLGLIGAVAAAGLVAQRGSINETALSPLQKRLLYLVEQYPEPTATYALLFAAALPGVRPYRAGYDRDLTGLRPSSFWEKMGFVDIPSDEEASFGLRYRGDPWPTIPMIRWLEEKT